jgi:methyl-accepting chemotaxis protein
MRTAVKDVPFRNRFAVRVTLVLVAVAGVLVLAGLETYLSIAGTAGTDAVALVGSVVTKLVLYALVSLLLVGVVVGYNAVVTLNHLAVRAEALAEGDLDVTFETEREDEFGSVAASLARMRDALVEKIEAAETARADAETERAAAEAAAAEAEAERAAADAAREAAEVATAEAERERALAEERLDAVRQNEHLRETAAAYRDVLVRVAEGDLTARVDPDAEEPAMAEIGHAINAAVGELQTTARDLSDFAALVAATSQTLDAETTEATDAGAAMLTSVEEITDGASRQTEMLADLADAMGRLAAVADETDRAADELKALSARAATVGETGKTAASTAITEMDAVKRRSHDAVGRIEALAETIEAVGESTAFITGVAEQINILALNASIEAARSGEEGQGFAVVAQEVKNLAEETKSAADAIETLVADLEREAGESVADIRGMPAHVDSGVETVDAAVRAFEDLADYVETLDEGIDGITEATTAEADSAARTLTTVDAVSEISARTGAESETILQAAREQARLLGEMTREAGTLASRANELTRTADRLRTDDEPSSRPPRPAPDGRPATAAVPGGERR